MYYYFSVQKYNDAYGFSVAPKFVYCHLTSVIHRIAAHGPRKSSGALITASREYALSVFQGILRNKGAIPMDSSGMYLSMMF